MKKTDAVERFRKVLDDILIDGLLKEILDSSSALKLPENRVNKQIREVKQIVQLYPKEYQVDVLAAIRNAYKESTSGWSALKQTRINYTLREPVSVVREQIDQFVRERGKLPNIERLKHIIYRELIMGENCATEESYSAKVDRIGAKGYKGLNPTQKRVKHRQSNLEL